MRLNYTVGLAQEQISVLRVAPDITQLPDKEHTSLCFPGGAADLN